MDALKAYMKAMKCARSGDMVALTDSFEIVREIEKDGLRTIVGDKSAQISDKLIYNQENFAFAHNANKEIRKIAGAAIRAGLGDEKVDLLYKRTYLFDAPYDFDAYCLYLEWDREKEKRFYLPRRKQLLPLVKSMQELADDKLDLLAISLPPGVGKTSTAIFYLTWMAGRSPELQCLTCSHNNDFLRGVYDECIRITDKNGEYLWHDVFPKVGRVSTNAKGLRIDYGFRKRFETLEFTARGSQNAGKVRATNLLYCDDLVSGIEEAMSADQMDKLWNVYSADFRQRKQGNVVKELHIATRWATNDVIGRWQDKYAEDERSKFIACPALDENDESNFCYPYGLGFSTEFYHEQRDVMDNASWKALFMNQPVNREGQLYEATELRRFFVVPEREPDGIVAVLDVADGGGDSWAMPIAYIYGNDYYIKRFLFDNGKPDLVEKRIVQMLVDEGVQSLRVESNRGGGRVAESIQNELKRLGSHCMVTTKWNETNKATRILMSAAWVKHNCLFIDESMYKQDKEYRNAMNEFTSYAMVGGKANKHDDAADAMSMLEDFVKSVTVNTVQVMRRPW